MMLHPALSQANNQQTMDSTMGPSNNNQIMEAEETEAEVEPFTTTLLLESESTLARRRQRRRRQNEQELQQQRQQRGERERMRMAQNHMVVFVVFMYILYVICRFGFGWTPGSEKPSPSVHVYLDWNALFLPNEQIGGPTFLNIASTNSTILKDDSGGDYLSE